MEGMRNEYHRYDIIEAEIKMTTPSGSVQKKKRPYVIVGNEKGTTTAPTVIAMPLTHIIKRTGLPTHGCISANSDTGLSLYSREIKLIRMKGDVNFVHFDRRQELCHG